MNNKLRGIYILGAGGMAREAYQIYRSLKKTESVKGFIISLGKADSRIFGVPVLGSEIIDGNHLLISAIGTPKRETWINELESHNNQFDILVDPTAVIGLNVNIGTGSMVCANSILTCDIDIGRHTIINTNVSVHHNSQIGNFVTIGPGDVITGYTKIGDGTFLGAGVTVIPGTKIGKNCFIGAGSTVVKDIPDSYLAYGTPAKLIKKLKDPDWDKLI